MSSQIGFASHPEPQCPVPSKILNFRYLFSRLTGHEIRDRKCKVIYGTGHQTLNYTGVRIMHMRLALAAVALLSGVSTTFAQNTLEFVHPESDTEVALDTYQEVRVRWLRGDRPVVGGTVNLRTDLGAIEVEKAFTDSKGLAAFAISSSREGRATLRASAVAGGETTGVELVLRFSASVESDRPFGNLAEERRLEGQLPLWIFRDRIGFLARGEVNIGDVARIAKAAELIQLTPLSESLFVLKKPLVPEGQDVDLFLRGLARSLERDHPEVFRAGRVARIVGTSQWLIVPDQVIVKFASSASATEIDAILDPLLAVKVERAPRDPQRYVITLPSDGQDALQTAYQLSREGVVQYAEPNYLIAIELRDPTTDDGFSFQWHHENDGTYATEDADIDSARAWTYSAGSEDVTIAVIDRGFDINHPDLVDNLVCDPGEWCEALGKRAINVTETDPDPTSLLSFATAAGTFAHGTEAAGVAAERGGNTIGYSGTCPHCRLMLIRNEESLGTVANAFDEAIYRNVDVISNSWGFAIGSDPNDPTSAPMKSIVDKINVAVTAGITVAFAMSNYEYDNCVSPPDTSSLPNVIGVSGSTDYDRRSNINGEAMGFGPCMDVLAPTRGGERGIRTTSVTRLSGVVTSTYWHDFSGTSAATPMVAGIVGLMKGQMSELSPLQVQRVLQDTADRVDPQHAAYSPETGFSETSGNSTHGYGRVNGYEAVRLVAPLNPASTEVPAGRGGRDLVLRDHEFDWGNTERSSDVIFNSPREKYTSHRSVDIKVDAFPFQTVTQDAAGFVALAAEEPEPGTEALIYVRVRNRGPLAVQEAQLKLHHALVGDTLPDLPIGFWGSFPADPTGASDWQTVPYQSLENIAYSGSSIAGCPARAVGECLPSNPTVDDAVRVVVFEVPALDWNSAAGERLALLAVVHSAEDPVQGAQAASSAGFEKVLTAVTQDNNVTLWLSGVEVVECPQWLIVLIFILLLAAVALLLWLIWSLINGNPVATILALLAIVIILLIVIAVLRPDCCNVAMSTLGL